MKYISEGYGAFGVSSSCRGDELKGLTSHVGGKGEVCCVASKGEEALGNAEELSAATNAAAEGCGATGISAPGVGDEMNGLASPVCGKREGCCVISKVESVFGNAEKWPAAANGASDGEAAECAFACTGAAACMGERE